MAFTRQAQASDARWGPHAPTQGGHRYRGENGLFLETVVQMPSRAPNCSSKAVRSVSRETLQLWSIRPARRRSFFGLENGHLRHQIIKKIRCAAFMKAAPYRTRRKLSLTWGAAHQNRRLFYENRSKVTFSQCFTGFHPLLHPVLAGRTPDLQLSTGCHPPTGRAGVWSQSRGLVPTEENACGLPFEERSIDEGRTPRLAGQKLRL